MAFQARNLAVLAYANGFTLWFYCTEDAPEAVESEQDGGGYFGPAQEMLRVGDMILTNAGAEGGLHAGQYLVKHANDKGVRVQKMLAA